MTWGKTRNRGYIDVGPKVLGGGVCLLESSLEGTSFGRQWEEHFNSAGKAKHSSDVVVLLHKVIIP